MKYLLGLAGLLVLGCSEATAPVVDCQGTLEVTVRVTRFGSDTSVVCAFPRDTLPPEPPDTTDTGDCPHHDGHHHHRDHDHRGHR